jgi:hypothetical protein
MTVLPAPSTGQAFGFGVAISGTSALVGDPGGNVTLVFVPSTSTSHSAPALGGMTPVLALLLPLIGVVMLGSRRRRRGSVA